MQLLKYFPTTADFERVVATVFSERRPKHRWFRRKEQERISEEMKLQYLFGGQMVAYIRRKEGLEIVGVGDEIPAEIDKLSERDQEHVVLAIPDRWDTEPECLSRSFE